MLETISTTYRSWAFRVTVWLLLAGLMAGVTFMVWVASEVKPTTNMGYKIQDNSDIIDPAILLANQKPAETGNLVQPIKYNTIIKDMRNYPKEFKDSKFIKTNESKFTLQVMNVMEHDVVTDYLNNRTGNDRDKFNYVRIIDKDNQTRYVLTYGIFNSKAEAEATERNVNFSLPDSIEVFAESFKAYAPLMDEYEITPPIQDKSAKRDVKLQGTPTEVPAKPKKQEKPVEKTFEEKKRNPTQLERDFPSRKIEQSANKNDTLNVQETKRSSSTDALAKPRENNQTAKSFDDKNRQEFNNRQDNSTQNKPLNFEKSPPPVLKETPQQTEKPRQAEKSHQAEKPSVSEREKANEKFPVVPHE